MIQYVKKHGCAVLWKPKGLWYALGTGWIDWCISEMPQWLHNTNAFRLKIHADKILFINTLKKLEAFDKKYRQKGKYGIERINWLAIAKKYHGVEIAPHFWKRRYDFNFMWYSGWDVASGCIWNKDAIIRIEKIGKLRKQPYRLTNNDCDKIYKMIQAKTSLSKIALKMGVSVSTIYRINKELSTNTSTLKRNR